MSWTNIPKPAAQTYINQNPIGKEQYDQPTITYDSSDTYYDGVNPNQWSYISKPNGFGLFTWQKMIMTWMNANGIWGSNASTWINISKPT